MGTEWTFIKLSVLWLYSTLRSPGMYILPTLEEFSSCNLFCYVWDFVFLRKGWKRKNKFTEYRQTRICSNNLSTQRIFNSWKQINQKKNQLSKYKTKWVLLMGQGRTHNFYANMREVTQAKEQNMRNKGTWN